MSPEQFQEMVEDCGDCVPGEACVFHRVVRKLKLQRNSVRRIEEIELEGGDGEDAEEGEGSGNLEVGGEEVSMDDLYVFY